MPSSGLCFDGRYVEDHEITDVRSTKWTMLIKPVLLIKESQLWVRQPVMGSCVPEFHQSKNTEVSH